MSNCPHCGQPMPVAAPAAKAEAPKKLQMHSIFWFGKYRDETIQHVLGLNPQYLIWAQENVENFDLDQEILDKATRRAESEREARRIGNSYNRSWGSDRYDDLDDDIPF